MTKQPTPEVTDEDVARIVYRDFVESEVEEVLSLLDEYGIEERHREHARVRLAALKLANGSINRLRSAIENAKCDYRDTLGPAEYSGYLKHFNNKMTEAEKREIIDSDWKKYQEWLRS